MNRKVGNYFSLKLDVITNCAPPPPPSSFRILYITIINTTTRKPGKELEDEQKAIKRIEKDYECAVMIQ